MLNDLEAHQNKIDVEEWHVPPVVEGAPFAKFAHELQALFRKNFLSSVRQAADKTGINHVTLTGLAKGLEKPTLKSIAKISRALNGDEEMLIALSLAGMGGGAALAGYITQSRLVREQANAYEVPETGAGVAETLRMLNDLADSYRDVKMIPLVGKVAAGSGVLVSSNFEGYVPCAKDMCVEGQQFFAVRVKGDSMEGEHIVDGSLLIVRKQDWAENGNIVACLTGDGDEVTVKKYRRMFMGAVLEAHYANGDRPTIPVNESSRILGVVLEERRRLV